MKVNSYFSDCDLFFGHIAADFDDLHAIFERLGYGVDDIRRADEQDPGEIDSDVEIVIEKVDVLLGIKQLKESR